MPTEGALRLATASAQQTGALAEAISVVLAPGDVVSLTGDLGAGKTAFVQGAARGLGIEGPVTSPTFMLIREYEGKYPLFHMDVYRLGNLAEVSDIGFEEVLDRGGVVFIEWGDAIEALLPEEHLRVELRLPPEGDNRIIDISPRGPGWLQRLARLSELTSSWKAG